MLTDKTYTLKDLIWIMSRLRDTNDGCPWDIEQDYASIVPYTIEEAYEVADAVSRKHMSDLREELGDLLLQVVYYSRFAEEDGHFKLADVIHGICVKMLYRHPHVFEKNDNTLNTEEVHKQWERLKRQEKPEQQYTTKVGAVNSALPALRYAEKLGAKAAQYAFDWPDIYTVVEKVQEECAEILAQDANLEEEIGDLMFATIQLCRKAKLDPETTLRKASMKFQNRFNKMAESQPLPNTLEDWERRWQQVKKDRKCDE